MVEPYLSFEGRCEEAIEFYRRALGAQVEFMMRMKESPEPPPPGTLPRGAEDKILHASIRVGETRLMMSDGSVSGQPSFNGIALSIAVANEAEADRVFAALADGGTVQMPLAKTFFSPRFGMVADRFGVGWMVIAQA
jgi:PhnB protein